ncbi:acyl carrier protein [Streptomyces sp. NPDC005402]|uniref:acyl carrier protein n=1 Tax=Streptomyces sp. NPDC005402 TaxID=3155338 RepID=UPI0033A0EA40
MEDQVRAVLSTVPQLAGIVEDLPSDADLWSAGMNSLTSVQVLMRLEDSFDIEFREEDLTRETFGSLRTIAAAVSALLAATENHRS